MAASTASGKLIHPRWTANPENISVSSLGNGMPALSGTISRKTPSTPKRSIMPVIRAPRRSAGGRFESSSQAGSPRRLAESKSR